MTYNNTQFCKDFDLKLAREERTSRMANPIAASIAREPFAWPGGYERFAVTDDGGCLCAACCKSEYAQIASASDGDGWKVIGQSSAAETDAPTFCDHCGVNIVECWKCESSDYCTCEH